jgi:hypothetical protein
MGGTYIREQKHICGDSYDTAGYMEVDIYPVTDQQHRGSRAARKKEATSLAQQTYNESRAKRYHVQLVNTNFKEGDYSWTGTYDDDHLPDPEDTKQVDKDFGNYVKRIYRWCRKNGVQRPKWVMVAEYATKQDDGTFLGRHHIHAIFEHTDGLTRDVMEELWADRKGNRIGMVRCDRLQMEHGSAEGLVKYISKNRRCARHWRQSRDLKKPVTPRPSDSKWSRKRFIEASTLYVDDREFWEKKFPGYTLNRVETKVNDSGHRHTLVIMRRRDGKRGAGRSRKLE